MTPYEMLKDVAAFWMCYLDPDPDGVLNDVNDCIGEVCQDNGYGIDVSAVVARHRHCVVPYMCHGNTRM